MEKSELINLDKDKKDSLPKEYRKNKKLIVTIIAMLMALVVVLGIYIYIKKPPSLKPPQRVKFLQLQLMSHLFSKQ
jgi:hypothetical protein